MHPSYVGNITKWCYVVKVKHEVVIYLVKEVGKILCFINTCNNIFTECLESQNILIRICDIINVLEI